MQGPRAIDVFRNRHLYPISIDFELEEQFNAIFGETRVEGKGCRVKEGRQEQVEILGRSSGGLSLLQLHSQN